MKLSVKHTVDQWFNKIAKNPALGVTVSILWLILICWVAFGWNLGNTGLVDETEPLFAEASRQMLVTGDWITPFFDGETRFDKPALIYWCQAIAYAIIGVNEWAVRLPSAIAAFGLVCLAFYTIQWYFAKQDELEQVSRPTRRYKTSFIAAALMALNPETIIWARTGVSDMLLTACMASALLCFFLGYAANEGGREQGAGSREQGAGSREQGAGSREQGAGSREQGAGSREQGAGSREQGAGSREQGAGSREQGAGSREQGENFSPLHPSHRPSASSVPFLNKWYLAFYVLIAGAILTKGPVGIVLPGLIVAAFLLYVGKFREVLRQMRLLVGILIILGLSVPWYALVISRNGWNYINSFFGYHNLERFTEVVNGHSAPWYFYFLVVLLGFAPYSVYLPASIIKLKFWQRSHWRSLERFQQFGLFAWFWFASVFGFFTIAVTKLPSYVLPLMPAAAILVALLWSDFFQDTEARQIIAVSSSPTSPISPSFLRVSGWVNVVFLSVLATALFNITHILGTDPAISNFHELIQRTGLPVIAGVMWLVCALLVAGLLLSRRWNYVIGINLIGFVAFLIFVLTPASFFIDRERQLPLRELSAVILETKQPNEELIMLGFKKPSVVFYSHIHVNYLGSPQEAIEHIKNQAAKGLKPASVLLLAEQKKFLQMDLQPDDYKNLSTKGAYNLVRVPFKKKKSEKMDIS